MVDMVLGLYFCPPFRLHRVYLHLFLPHLQSSLPSFKIKQRRMYKAYIKIRTAENCIIFRRANTIDETHSPFSSSKLHRKQMSSEEESVLKLLLLFTVFHVEWMSLDNLIRLNCDSHYFLRRRSLSEERIRWLELALRSPRLLPQVDDIEITPKTPPIGELTASKWSLVSVLEITKRSDKFGLAIA